MERLTEWDEFGNADIIALSDMMPEIYAELSFSETNALTEALNRLAKYEDNMPLERAQELAQSEKDGRIVILPPVKVGDTAFFIINKSIYEGEVYYMRWEHHKSFGVRGDISADSLGGCIGARLCDFGKTVFLTREEAEAALKKREADNEADR